MDQENLNLEKNKAREERMRVMKMQRTIRTAAVVLAIVLSLISICVSCSTRSAVKELAEQIAAKKAAAAAVETMAEEQENAVTPLTSGENDAKPGEKNVTISFIGDCTLCSYEGAAAEDSFEAYYSANGADYFFQNVKSIFEGDDLTVANLEGTFTTSANRADKTWTFKADPSYVDILSRAGIDCVNVANNHTHDYGDESYVDTLATLDVAGISRFGNDYNNIVEVHGVKVGLAGIYECEVGADCLDQALSGVKSLKEKGAEVIVCAFHWGDENATAPSNINVELAHAVIDAGADVVIGTHPHALQGIECYRGKYICYSMGNFCVGGNGSYKDKDTMIFQQTFTVKDGKAQNDAVYQIIPCSISTDDVRNTYRPTPSVGDEAERILNKIYDLSGQLEGGITR